MAIIGGGAAAFGAAIRGNDLGAKTAVINHGLPLGGTCVNVGCVPSKTLLWASEVLRLAQHHAIPGIRLDLAEFDFAKVIGHELALVSKLRAEKYERVLADLDHLTPIEGRARFVSPTEIEVNRERLSADKFVIAVGSTATVPPITGLRETGFLTHTEALQLTTQPRELVIIGAGPQGLEFAQMYARFGTRVTILQRGRSIFPRTEPALAAKLTELLRHQDIVIETNVAVRSVRAENGRKVVNYSTDRSNSVDITADAILLAAGKTPNTGALGLDTIGSQVDGKQAIRVSQDLRTTQPHVYAAGDVVNLPKRVEMTAGREGSLAAENALTGSRKSIDYDAVSYTVFTDPQLAASD